jgi:hypothetical protein
METKICSICGRELIIDEFPINRGMADGHLGKCYKCWAKFTLDKNRVLAMAGRKQDQKEEPKPNPKPKVVEPKKPKVKKTRNRYEYNRAWYLAHKEEHKESMRKYRNSEKGRETTRRSQREWYENLKKNPEKYRAYIVAQNERKRKRSALMTDEQRAAKNAKLKAYYQANKERWQKYNKPKSA